MQHLVRAFLIDRQGQSASHKTLQWHETAFKRFNAFLSESEHSSVPADWTAGTLREYTVWLQQQSLSPYSIRTYANSLWAFCRWLYQEELITVDIAAKAKKPKLPKDQKAAFAEDDVLSMLHAAKRTQNAHRDTAIMLLLLDTGIRASELCNLTVRDFLQADNLILIRQGKGNKDRAVPISVQTSVALTRYLHRRTEPINDNGTALFMSAKSKHLTPSGLLQLVKRIASSAGVEDVHPHRFRHTAALYFLRNGGDSLVLQRILGHTTLQMTNRYVHLLTDDIATQHAKASPVLNLKR